MNDSECSVLRASQRADLPMIARHGKSRKPLPCLRQRARRGQILALEHGLVQGKRDRDQVDLTTDLQELRQQDPSGKIRAEQSGAACDREQLLELDP